jgi:phage baseplate assembly protein gpV
MSKARNVGKADAASILGALASARIGLVTSYDPIAYAVKVNIMPEEVETGWLKIKLLQLVPHGFGIYAAPDIGVQALVSHQEGDRDSGICIGFINDDEEDLPPPSPGVLAGEIHVLHKSGSFLKFTADGDVLVAAARDLTQTVGRNYSLTVQGDVTETLHGKQTTTVSGQHVLECSDINLGDVGGKHVALDQDPVASNKVSASSTKVKAL